MQSERWTEIEALFHRALEVPGVERLSFLAGAAGGDRRLEAEVSRLLEAHEAAGADFLDPPGADSGARHPSGEDPSPVGRQIGAYRLLEEIGRGGMGSVYLAERADLQYEKRLAIKLVNRGMDSDSVLRRFRAERQILASMDHPNIAKLHDGGTTEEGRPYFVMELIEGKPIDEYAEAQALSIEMRLRLFRQVCSAVSYAHQHLVIHRDLKPSNILVTAEGTVKLLDFGIARFLGAGESDTPSTVTVLGLMTPEYASPEQIQGRHATTSSDVYALGLVLYRLLTGSPPYRFESRSPEELARVIGSIEPARPSTAGPGTRRLRGDLDNIVLMALRKDPDRRYSSVEQFSEDIHRHLSGLPVIARPDTVGYRMAKFARRNRVAVIGGAAVFLTLVGGIAATSWQADRALEQERVARAAQARAERRFQEVRQLARTVLFDYHDAIKDLPGSTPIRERLVRDAMTYLDVLRREAGADTGLLSELANAYERIGDVQGGSQFANLGNTSGAIDSYRKALELYEARQALAPTDVTVRRDLAVMRVKLGQLAWESGDSEPALQEMRQAIIELKALARERPGNDAILETLSAAHSNEGMILQDRGEIEPAIESIRASIETAGARPDQQSEPIRRSRAVEYEHLASALTSNNQLPDALTSIREAIELWTGLLAESPLNADYQRAIGVARFFEGDILARTGRSDEALAAHRQYLESSKRLGTLDPENDLYRDDQGYALVRVADLLVTLERLREAVDHYEQSLVLRQSGFAADPVNLWKRATVIESRAKLSKALALAGHEAAVIRHCRQALDLMSQATVEPKNAMIRGFFAETYADLGEAFATLAAHRGTAPADRPAHWREAHTLYRQSADVWRDMQSLGIVSPIDAEKPIRVAEALARCDAALRAQGSR